MAPGRDDGREMIRLGEICAEAVRRHGDDIGLAQAYVQRALAKLDPGERSRLEGAVARVLGWRELGVGESGLQ